MVGRAWTLWRAARSRTHGKKRRPTATTARPCATLGRGGVAGGARCEAPTEDGVTTPVIAPKNWNVAIAVALLEAGTHVGHPVDGGDTAPYETAQDGHSAVASVLLGAETGAIGSPQATFPWKRSL